MTIRCLLDGLLLDARVGAGAAPVTAYDGDEAFDLEAVEALFYEIVSAHPQELLSLEQARYRLLRVADDFLLLGA